MTYSKCFVQAEKKRLYSVIRKCRNKQSELEEQMKEDEPVNIAAIELEKKVWHASYNL